MNINLFSLSGSWIVITYLPMILLLFIKGRSKLAWIFGLHMLAVVNWGLGAAIVAVTPDPKLALKLWWFAETGVIFIPVFFYHAIAIMTKDKSRVLLILIYVQAIIFLLALHNGYLINTTKLMFGTIHYKQANFPFFHIFFVVWILVVALAHYKLYKYFFICPHPERKLLKSQLIALFSFACGGTSFLPAFGIDLYPWGNFVVPVHSFCVAYAIFKHQLFDIRIAIKRSLVYSSLVLLLAILYLAFVYLGQNFLMGLWGYKSMIVSIITAFAIGIAFFPLHNKIQEFVDKFLFTNTPEALAIENQFLRQNAAQGEKMKMVATLASSIAHEIKNPLTALKTFFEYYPSKKNDPAFLEKFHKLGTSEVTRIEQILHELLEFAKPSPLTLKDTDIKGVIEHALNLTANQLAQSNIQVKAEIADRLPLVKADANKLLQVFINLIINAKDAMPQGGVLSISTSAPNHAPGTAANYDIHHTQNLTITVQDTGCGMDRKQIAKIFDPFYSTKESGTGLGLAIVKGIIEEHGGAIGVESDCGKGTKFKIKLPSTNL